MRYIVLMYIMCVRERERKREKEKYVALCVRVLVDERNNNVFIVVK